MSRVWDTLIVRDAKFVDSCVINHCTLNPNFECMLQVCTDPWNKIMSPKLCSMYWQKGFRWLLMVLYGHAPTPRIERLDRRVVIDLTLLSTFLPVMVPKCENCREQRHCVWFCTYLVITWEVTPACCISYGTPLTGKWSGGDIALRVQMKYVKGNSSHLTLACTMYSFHILASEFLLLKVSR